MIKLATVTFLSKHPNADTLVQVCLDSAYTVISKDTGNFSLGDTVVFFPVGSVLTVEAAAILQLPTKIKPKKIRGVQSEGIIFSLSELSGILLDTIHPEIKSVVRVNENVILPDNFRFNYDIENFKYIHTLFAGFADVVITEKLHGTLCAVMADAATGFFGVSSKGLLKKGEGIPLYASTLYTSNSWLQDVRNAATTLSSYYGQPVTVFGEIYGKGVQDLDYGLYRKEFSLFDIRRGADFLDAGITFFTAQKFGIPHVPLLYSGPYSKEVVEFFATSVSSIGGGVREGCVVKSSVELKTSRGDRIIAKAINPAYLSRKNGTEYA